MNKSAFASLNYGPRDETSFAKMQRVISFTQKTEILEALRWSGNYLASQNSAFVQKLKSTLDISIKAEFLLEAQLET